MFAKPRSLLWFLIALASSSAGCGASEQAAAVADARPKHGGDREEDTVRLDSGTGSGSPDAAMMSMPGSSCRANLNCGDCIQKFGCGWCPSSGSCEEGDQHGPASGSCPDFGIQPATCSLRPDSGPGSGGGGASCTTHQGCGDCTATMGCGFCASNGQCLAGHALGPNAGACQDWQFFPSDCSGSGSTSASCAAHSSCGDCATESGCGWCASSSLCEPGNARGPTNGSCARWEMGAAQCSSCDSITSCGSCSSQPGCGWCADRNQCQAGTTSGPSVGFCAQWESTPSMCMSGGSSSACSGSRDCNSCASHSGCGWCESTRACEAGSSLGPISGTCANWDYSPSSCTSGGGGTPTPRDGGVPTARDGGTTTPPGPRDSGVDPNAGCDTTYTCDECANTAGCGWCEDTQSCLGGNTTGPWSGSCTAWSYTPSSCPGGGTGTGSDPCSNYPMCGDCTLMSGCGYCSDTAACESGTAAGPASGSCTTWAWLDTECPGGSGSTGPDPCASAAGTCGDCTQLANCGWCNDSGACETGDSSGPTSSSCTDWAWYSSSCGGGTSSDPCATAASTCSDCTALNGCGYCEDSASCESGDSNGPSAGSCTGWDWYSSSCPGSTAPDPCTTAAYTCSDCTALNGCGYCEDNASCESGDSAGPSSGFCSSWAWYSSSCSGGSSSDPCTTAAYTCTDCTALNGCGYCEDNATCESGDSAGPTSGFCSGWDWYSSSCGGGASSDPCATAAYTCTDCTALNGCGFCEDNSTCESGDVNGPASGFCSGWAWYSSSCGGGATSDPCASAAYTCGDCTALNGCGWCDDNYSCESGDAYGPTSSSCFNWAWVSSSCP